MPSYAQKIPISRCASVRTVGVVTPSPPKRFASSNAAAYSALVMSGGGGTRNCRPDLRTNGATSPQCAPIASGIRLTGSWRHLPGALLGNEVDADPRLGMLRTVLRALREDRRRRTAADLDAERLARVRRC